MNVRLGIVGPKDSIENITREAKEMDDLQLQSYSYNKTEDVQWIIEQHDREIDYWLFSGQAPFYYALAMGYIDESRASFPPLYGTSLLSKLVHAQYETNQFIRRLSVDTINQQELDSFRRVIDPHNVTLHSFPYSGYMPSEEIVSFHEGLYKKGEIEVAFTSIRAVYEELKQRKVPCYRVTPTDVAIRLALTSIQEKMQLNMYRKSQIAIVGIERLDVQSNEPFSFKMKHRELDMKRLLLKYTEQINGSYVQMGDRYVFLFTTLGEIEFQTYEPLFDLLEQCRLQTGIELKAVVGLGKRASDAERHVRQAFNELIADERPCIVWVDEEQTVHYHFKESPVMTYTQREWGPEWIDRFRDAQISPSVVAKLSSISSYYKQTIVTAQDIAAWTSGTERNARRILTALDKLGLAIVSGEEIAGNRGRPRKRYELKF